MEGLRAFFCAIRSAYPMIMERGVRMSWETPLIQFARALFCRLMILEALLMLSAISDNSPRTKREAGLPSASVSMEVMIGLAFLRMSEFK